MANIKTTSLREKEQEDEQLFVASKVGKTATRENDNEAEEEVEEEEKGDEQEGLHAQLVSDMMKMSKKRKMQQEVRTNLTNSTVDSSHLLTRLLPSTSLKKDRQSQTLPVPLERTVARRIKRAAGYEKVAMEVNKWAKVVKMRREADQLHFPLNSNDMSLKTVEEAEVVQMRSPLEQEVYSLLQGAKLLQGKKETEEEHTARKALSLQQIRERNRELWRQKEMKRRYEQKARLMNKSKSRKHHRLLRRERLRKQKAELEELQKTDPELALERLQELERARIEERMSLRHKTSKWAHLQGFRATRDKNAMAALRENQRMHQELTTKAARPPQDEDEDATLSSEGEGEAAVQGMQESDNPWTKNIHGNTHSKSVSEDESFTRFKKFWEEVNKRKKADQEIEKQLEKEREGKNVEDTTMEEENDGEKEKEIELEEEEKEGSMKEGGEQTQEEEKEVNKDLKRKAQRSKDKTCKRELEKRESEGNEEEIASKNIRKKSHKKSKKPMEDPDQEAVNVDDLFDKVEIGIKNKVKKKLKKLGIDSSQPWTEAKAKKKQKKPKETMASLEIEEFDFTSTNNQENIDEKRTRQDVDSTEGETVGKLQEAVHTLKGSGNPSAASAPSATKLQVDPNKFLQVEAKRLVAAVPDSVGEAGEAMEDGEEEAQETTEDIIREAFADDYLMEEFSSEKTDAIKKDQGNSMSLALPGWGDWTGPNIQMSNRKIKKFRLRVPHAPRKDSNIGHVLYNESADVHTNLRKAMVTELPYPFKSVKDFEASVRASVGRLFVPETAHKRMTAPPIVTKQGTMIQPMTEDELLHHEPANKGHEKPDKRLSEPIRGKKRKAGGGASRQQNPKRKVRQGGKKGTR